MPSNHSLVVSRARHQWGTRKARSSLVLCGPLQSVLIVAFLLLFFFFFHFIIAVSHSASACLIAIYWCCVPLVFLCAPFAILRIIIAVCVYLCRTVDLLNDRCGTTKAHERRNDKKQNKNNQRHKHTSPMAINISSVSLFSLSCAIGNQQRNFCAETFTYKTYLFILLLFIHVWWLCLSW